MQRIVGSIWKCWTREVFPTLVLRKKCHFEKRNVKVDDIVTVADKNAVRSKWVVGRVTNTNPGDDGCQLNEHFLSRTTP